MKKLLLTVFMAALFSMAAIAQERDSIRTESNQFRENTEESVEDASQNVQEGAEETEREAEEAGQNIRQESQNFREGVNETANEIEEGAERTGEDIEEGAERTGNEIEQGAERASDEVRQGAERTGDEIERRTDQMDNEMEQDPNIEAETDTLDQMNQDFESTVEPDKEGNRQGSGNYNTAPELEVVEGKEGPGNQVVYKYQGEFFYVDREKKQLVKAKESDLQDAKHEVIVNEGIESENNEDQNNPN